VRGTGGVTVRRKAGAVQGGGENISSTVQFLNVSAAIKGLPQIWKDEFVRELAAFQPKLEARMKAGVPVRKGPRPTLYARSRQGATRPIGGGVSLLSTKLDEKELRLSGGLLTADARARGFYLFILDAGRGLKHRMSRPRQRLLSNAPSLTRGFGGQKRNRYSIRYTRKISPILPGTYDITFGVVRYWARGELGPVLDRIYARALSRLSWSRP
jgi:hypothetical protein